MTREELQVRLTNKQNEIAKTEKLLAKYLAESTPEERSIVEQFLSCGDYSLHRGLGYSDAWGKAVALYDARKTLEKYQNQLKALEAKEAKFSELPAVLIQFRDNLINKWDAWDAWKQEEIRKQRKTMPDYYDRDNYIKWHHEMKERWGTGWREFSYLTHDQIHKTNVTAADDIVENLINRTSQICGTITDCSCLSLDSDNQGYLIINGVIKGTQGCCRVESIGAGGYNIQRYHIRVLVKPVK